MSSKGEVTGDRYRLRIQANLVPFLCSTLRRATLVTTLLSDFSHLELLERDLVSVRSTQTGVSLGENENVTKVDHEKDEDDPDQSHESLKELSESACVEFWQL